MKKKFIKMTSIFSMLILLFALSIPAVCLASQNEENQPGLSGPSDTFIEVCDNLFTDNTGGYKAIDKDGNDITTTFTEEYAEAYNSGDYQTIWQAVLDDLQCVTWPEAVQEEPQTRAAITEHPSQSFYVLDYLNYPFQGKTFDMSYTISGTFQYEQSNGAIVYYSGATLNVNNVNVGSDYSWGLANISTRSYTTNNNQTVVFTASFYIDFSYRGVGFGRWGAYGNSVVC